MRRIRDRLDKLWIVTCLCLVSGCLMIPQPIPNEVFQRQAELDRKLITANQEPVDGPISLYEAIGRALKYNLDFHLERAEKILALNEMDVSEYELLPQLVGEYSYAGRSNFSGASSRSLITGAQSLQSSTSSDRDVNSANLSLSWNVLDFGISYIRAKQAADRVMVAEEETREVTNRLVQDTRAAYWRAVINERLVSEMDDLLVKVNQAIADSQRVEVERLDRPLTALTYQRELLDIKRELEQLQRNLSVAKIQLAALMNLPLGQDYSLVIPERTDYVKSIGISPQLMEQIALENRPEIREVSYQKRINSYEAKAAVLSLFPNLSLNFGGNYSDNSFLFENDWLSYGTRITGDLINLFKIPATNREFEAREKLLDAQRLTLSMAIITQVYVSLARFEYSRREFETAADYNITQQKILDQLISAERMASISQQSLIREEMNSMVAEIRYDIAYSELENSYAAIFAALGLDLLPNHAFLMPLWTLEDILERKFSALSLHDEIFEMKVADTLTPTISSPAPPTSTPPVSSPDSTVSAPSVSSPESTASTPPISVPESTESPPASQITPVPSATPRVSSFSGDQYGPATLPETLWSIADRVRPDNTVTVQQMMLAIWRANPGAFISNNINGLLHGQILRIPGKDEVLNTSANEAYDEVSFQNTMWEELKCILMIPEVCR